MPYWAQSFARLILLSFPSLCGASSDAFDSTVSDVGNVGVSGPGLVFPRNLGLEWPPFSSMWQIQQNFGQAEMPHPSQEGIPAPSILPQWSADTIEENLLMTLNFRDGKGQYYYDKLHQRSRSTCTYYVDYFTPNQKMVQDMVYFSEGGNATFNDVCLPMSGLPFKTMDMFDWIRFANFGGHRFFNGVPCTLWTLTVTNRVNNSALIGKDGVPRLYHSEQGSGIMAMAHTITFVNISTGEPAQEVFEPTVTCATSYPNPACEKKRIDTIDVFRLYGPPEQAALENRNAGDALGDLSFACTQGAVSSQGKLVAQWKVDVNMAFGQYMFCNYRNGTNVCSGAPEQNKRVGRRSAQLMGVGPHGGQCSANDDVGTQYSFPAAAACAPGESPVIEGSCAWGQARVVRTISAKCLFDERGLLNACAQDIGHAPFKHALDVWMKAFESEDPSLGGCPTVATSNTMYV